MEDTYNLLGHALRKALGVIARQQGRGLAEVATEAGASVLVWHQPESGAGSGLGRSGRADAGAGWGARCAWCGGRVLWTVAQGNRRLSQRASRSPGACESRTWKKGPTRECPVLRRGVARERVVSVEDPQMRHGRKSRSVRFTGYKRHVLRDLDTGLVRAVGLTPANAPEASVTESIAADLARQPDCEL